MSRSGCLSWDTRRRYLRQPILALDIVEQALRKALVFGEDALELVLHLLRQQVRRHRGHVIRTYHLLDKLLDGLLLPSGSVPAWGYIWDLSIHRRANRTSIWSSSIHDWAIKVSMLLFPVIAHPGVPHLTQSPSYPSTWTCLSCLFVFTHCWLNVI